MIYESIYNALLQRSLLTNRMKRKESAETAFFLQAENLRSKPTVVSNYMIGSKADLQRPPKGCSVANVGKRWFEKAYRCEKTKRHLTTFCHQATWAHFPDAGRYISAVLAKIDPTACNKRGVCLACSHGHPLHRGKPALSTQPVGFLKG